MAIDELRRKLDAPHDVRLKWCSIQILLAASLRKGILRKARAGKDEEPFFVPAPEEIFNETIIRILDGRERYDWDGASPPTFDEFFADCLHTTANYFWAKARGLRHGALMLQRSVVPPTVRELSTSKQGLVEERDSNAALATAIAKTRIHGFRNSEKRMERAQKVRCTNNPVQSYKGCEVRSKRRQKNKGGAFDLNSQLMKQAGVMNVQERLAHIVAYRDKERLRILDAD